MHGASQRVRGAGGRVSKGEGAQPTHTRVRQEKQPTRHPAAASQEPIARHPHIAQHTDHTPVCRRAACCIAASSSAAAARSAPSAPPAAAAVLLLLRCVCTHPLVPADREALTGDGFAIPNPLDERVAHNGVRVFACTQASRGGNMSTRPAVLCATAGPPRGYGHSPTIVSVIVFESVAFRPLGVVAMMLPCPPRAPLSHHGAAVAAQACFRGRRRARYHCAVAAAWCSGVTEGIFGMPRYVVCGVGLLRGEHITILWRVHPVSAFV